MKRWLAILLTIVGVVAVVGAGFGINYLVNKNKEQANEDALAKYSAVEYFESEQVKEQPAVMRAYAVGDEQFTKITYQIDTAEEVTVSTAKYDKASEDWAKYDNDFEDMNYIDTGVISIDLSELTAGKHILQVFVYAGSDVTECICEKIFTIQ